MTPLVSAERLTRRFGGGGLFRHARVVHAVSDVSLTVGRAEAVGLVGESGSGKSTIGRLILGLLPVSEGRVLLDGVDIAGPDREGRAERRRRMQLVFQDPYASLDPRRRIGPQIEDGLAINNRVPRAQRRTTIKALLAQVGLTAAHADRFPHEFSGGQRQRVGIARALATSPDFLVADEAVSALDVSVQAQIIALFADLRTRLGIGMLFISHDLKIVRSLCDRVIVLYLGRIMEEGPAEDVLERPKHPYTQALLSASPSLDPTRRRVRILLGGDPPSPSNPPSGCVFRTRCPIAIDACAATPPPLDTVGPNHRVACIRVEV
ncbi:ABC transporter ATP-binding protein [Acidisphaera sp. L21]|uniref:ABC transporter ATP-binding protein n=1 Tax=Acidisphaera sp. L21 TaxID=1641851 RepID=UPI0020B16CBC|nr:oligopeptide/dipeptide ABC transporter ATP-binding protein [Acidisphaera sp. L21]